MQDLARIFILAGRSFRVTNATSLDLRSLIGAILRPFERIQDMAKGSRSAFAAALF